MKYPFLPLPFLKLVVSPTINNWCSFLISTFAVSNIVNTSRIIILSLICYSSSRSSNSLVAMSLENHHCLIWKINSHSIQMIVVLRQSEHKLNNWAFLLSLQVKKVIGGLIPLDMGTSLKSQFQPSKHLICFAMFQKRLWCLNSKPFNWTIT